MAVRAELQLGIRNFQQNLKTARRDVRRETSAMKRDAGSVGASLASGLKSAAGAVGLGFGVTELFQQFKQAAAEAAEMRNLAASLNEPIEALARLKFAAEAMRVDFSAASEVTRELEDRLGDLGNSEPMEVLNRLGLEAESLIAMPIDEKILTLSEAFQKGRKDGVAYSDMLKLVGDSVGESLLPLITKSREELESLFANAPDDIGATVTELAKMDSILAKSGATASNWFKKQAAEAVVWGTILKDVVATGSVEEALVRAGERDDAAIQDLLDQEENARLKAQAIAAARESEEIAKEEAAAAKELEKAMAAIAKIRSDMAAEDLELLPPAERVAALQSQLESFVSEKMSPFGLNFEESIAGMEALARSRQESDSLPATGQNSALEVFEWLEQARDMVEEIGDLQDGLADGLAKLREEAASGAFELMTPEEQARLLRDQLSASLGVDVSSGADIENGLKALQDEARKAREAGDRGLEEAALERLVAAQDQAMELDKLSSQLAPDESMATATEMAMGSVGRLYQQLFNVDPAKESADSLKKIEVEAVKQIDRLDKILTKMDTPPEPVRFNNF